MPFNQKNGSNFDSSRNFNREGSGNQGGQGVSNGFSNDFMVALQHRPTVTKTIQIAQPAIKATTYKVHHTAIQKQYYDIEERILIKPAGTIVVEFEHPIAKIPTDQTILPLGQLHPLVAKEYRNNGGRRISSNTVYSTAGHNSNASDHNGDNRNPYANYPQEQGQQQPQKDLPFYPYKSDQYRDSEMSRINERYETEDFQDNKSQIDQNAGRLGHLKLKSDSNKSMSNENLESNKEEETPAHVQEITSILKASNGSMQSKKRGNFNDKSLDED